MDENNQGGNQAGSPDAESRISELTSKINDLKSLLDQKNKLDQEEREARVAAQENTQQNLGYDPNSDEVKQWAPWLAPKLAPFLAERDKVIVALADKIDELETMRKIPEYEDEEYAKQVKKVIAETRKTRGITLSRMDAIALLKGQEMISGKGKAQEGQEQVQNVPQGRINVNSPVISGPGVGTTRAATPTNQKDPNDMSIEEFENSFRDLRV